MRNFFKLLLCVISFTAQADNQVVRIAISDFPPFEFFENGKIEGIDKQTISDVLTRAGYQVEFYPLPWKRALMLMDSGEMDALASIPKNSDTESLFIFSKPIMYTQYYFLKNKSLTIEPKNFSDIKNYNIGIIDGYFYTDKLNNTEFLQLSPITSPTPDVDNLQKLNHGRIDLVACSIHVCKYWLNKYNTLFSNIDYLTSLTIDDGHTLHVAFSKKDSARSNEIVAKFNTELSKYIEEGNIEKNITQYPEFNLNGNNFDRAKLQQ